MTAFTATIKLSIGSFQKNIFVILNIFVLLIIQQNRSLAKLYLLRFTCCKCAVKSWDVSEFFTTKPGLYARWNAIPAGKLTTAGGGVTGQLRISPAPSRVLLFIKKYVTPFTKLYPGVNYELAVITKEKSESLTKIFWVWPYTSTVHTMEGEFLSVMNVHYNILKSFLLLLTAACL